ncbi:MAG: hypothetical protein K2K09_01925, partial [Lachnospiraceae bacterium]|nr:hypothetical protein [Lachnospiraceae bacterium]
SSIYLAKGENILISDGNKDNYFEETLNFTYMNAGYTGYYNVENKGVDEALTMSVFEITANKIIVTRFDEEGIHDLKSAGVSNEHKNETANGKYPPNETVVESPAEIVLNKAITVPDPEPTKEPVNGRVYQKINSTADLKDGDKVLMIYNGSSFMIPETKEQSGGTGIRVGFKLESAGTGMDAKIVGDFEKKEWTFNQSGSGWTIGSGNKYIKLTDTADKRITATLESSGDVFTISGSSDSYTFAVDSIVLNYNEERTLINGYAGSPAKFYLYSYTGETGSTGNDCLHPRKHIIDVAYATCTEKGFTGNEVCTNCGDVITEGQVIEAIGHSWDEGVVTLAPTETAEGVKISTCKNCGEKKTEAIAKLAAKPVASDNPSAGDAVVKLKAVSISSVKNPAKKTMVIKWKKNADATGYEIQYAT